MSSELKSIRNRLAALLRDVDALLADEKPQPNKATSNADLFFDEWWSGYPKKVSKGAARTAYRAAWKKASAETLLVGLRTYKFSTDPKYIPHASTWLNDERWADEQKVKNAPQASKSDSYDSILGSLFPED